MTTGGCGDHIMKLKLLGLVACVALFGVSQAEASTIYDVNDTAGSLSVTGTITTDGTIGVLGSGDILAWSLIISGSGTPTPAMTSSNTNLLGLSESDLTATADALVFNYSGVDGGALIFATSGGPFLGFVGWIAPSPSCLLNHTSGCLYLEDKTSLPVASGEADRSGDLTIATLAPTPLPAALPLFGAGLGLMGLLARRRKRKSAPAVTA
jgi:hypothetical protein